jgi:hypothetical protein
MADEGNHPLVLFHDEELGVARVFGVPCTIDLSTEELLFCDRLYSRTSDGLVFWDHLVNDHRDIVGVALVDFDVAPPLVSEQATIFVL